MNLLNVPGVFGTAVGIVGLAYLGDAAVQIAKAPTNGDPTGVYSAPALDVSNLFNISARADEMSAPDDLSDLLRIDLPTADISINENIGGPVQSTATVTKIAYGNVSHVRVYSTATGAYSTDGLLSPHVQYPGIEVTQHRVSRHLPRGGFVWEGAFGWIPVPQTDSPSFLTYPGAMHTHQTPQSGGMNCVEQSGVLICS